MAARLPSLHRHPTVVLSSRVTALPTATSVDLVWPSQGSAAVSVPSAGVLRTSAAQPEVPIASLTKMMTADVALDMLPLRLGQRGPCLTVTAADVAAYEADRATEQSSVRVVEGDQLCERDLLDGLFVHSASNYASLLVRLTGLTLGAFLDRMNATALALGMTRTHYADVSGYDPHSISTAEDQMRLVNHIMQWPVVVVIVRQPSVNLPGAGTVGTFTPLLGQNGVVGIKSGHTSQAGGCDALALDRVVAGVHVLIYAVVLSQRGGDELYKAGEAAYLLADSAAQNVVGRTWHKGAVVGRVGWSGFFTPIVVAHHVTTFWWASTPPMVAVARVGRPTRYVAGERVASVVLFGTQRVTVPLVAADDVTAPSWWERLR